MPIPIAHCFGFTLFSWRLLLFPVVQSLFDCIIFLLENVQWLPKRSQAVKTVPLFLWSLISHGSPPVFYCPFYLHTVFRTIPFARAGLHHSSPFVEIRIIFQGSTQMYLLQVSSLITPSLSPPHLICTTHMTLTTSNCVL